MSGGRRPGRRQRHYARQNATAAERLDEAGFPELAAAFRVTAQQYLQTASRIELEAGLDAY